MLIKTQFTGGMRYREGWLLSIIAINVFIAKLTSVCVMRVSGTILFYVHNAIYSFSCICTSLVKMKSLWVRETK